MKSMSLFQIIVIGAFIALGGIGVFVFGTYNGSSSATNTIGPVTVWGVLPKNAIGQMLASGLTTNPSLKGVNYVEKQADTFTSDYIEAAAEGKAPDLLIMNSDDILGLRNTLLTIPFTSIPLRTFQETFVDAGNVLIGAQGFYGIPLAVDPLILYYNRPLLASAGIAQPPTTWNAILGMIPSLTTVAEGFRVTRATIDLGGYANIHNARGILSALFLQAGIPMVINTPQGFVANLTGQQATGGQTPVEGALSFYTSFANPSQSTYTWTNALPDSRALFLAGNLAFYLGYGSEYPFIQAANPNLIFDVARFPQLTGTGLRTTYAKVYAFVIPKASKNSAGALAVASALSSAPLEAVLVKAMGSIAPSRRDLAGQPTDGILSVINKDALVAKSWLSPDTATTDATFRVMITDVISGSKRISEAVRNAESVLTNAYK